jgi:uncharacterized protein (TIGR02453 family)
MAFTGIPAEAFDFYDALAADNTRTFWEEHKQEYLTAVRQPLTELGEELGPQFGEPHLYRPYRDIRFSKDKTPYKDHQGMFVEMRNGLGWYAQLSSGGLMVAGGWYTSSSVQVANFRAAVEADGVGELPALLSPLTAKGFTVDGQQLKSRPRGFDADHPRIEWLRYRTLYVMRRWEPAPWMGTRRAVSKVRDAWIAMTPTIEWLADKVGPGEAPVGGRKTR